MEKNQVPVADPNEPLNRAIDALPKRSSELKAVTDLCNVLIDRLRKDNDTATHEEVLANQGGLKELKRLKGYLETRNV
jgi:hypothetical protein